MVAESYQLCARSRALGALSFPCSAAQRLHSSCSVQGVVKLADFGVAAKLDQETNKLGMTVVGTPYWMAPEVVEMTGLSPASDIWSVGALAVELLTGQPPYFDLHPMSALYKIVQASLSSTRSCRQASQQSGSVRLSTRSHSLLTTSLGQSGLCSN